MPQVYRENSYATKAVKMFKPAYEIIKTGDGTRMREIEFIMTGISEDEDQKDKKDNNDLYEQATRYGPTDCECHFCEMVNNWDINIGLLGGDVFQNLVSKGLLVVLDNYNPRDL